MEYDGNEIMLMDEDTFSQHFKNKYVEVYLDNNLLKKGFVSKIEVSCIINVDTNDRLPCYIVVDGERISIRQVKRIKVND